MKKLIALLTVLFIVFSLAACSAPATENGGSTTTTTSATTTTTQNGTPSDDMLKNCVALLYITINPEFKLYLDKDGVVLGMEPLNDDAASFAQSVTYQDCAVETVMQNILTKANENGFTDENTNVQLDVLEIKPETGADLLKKAADSVVDTAEQLEIVVAVDAEVLPAPGTSTTAASTTTTTSATVVTTTALTTSATMSTTTASTTITSTTTTSTTTTSITTTTTTAPIATFTPITEKAGSWVFRFVNDTTLYECYLTLIGTPECGVGLGDSLTANFPEEDWEEAKPYCTLFEGEYYYIGRGDGSTLNSFAEQGITVSVTDGDGNVLVLTRIAENTMKVVTSPETFSVCGKIPENIELAFELNAEE